AELVFRADLPGETAGHRIEGIALDSGAAIREERARRLKLGNLFATCQKEPQLVLFDRPSQRAVEVIDHVDRRLARYTPGYQLLIDVGSAEAGVHPTEERIGMKLVAAVLGNHVGVDATAGN